MPRHGTFLVKATATKSAISCRPNPNSNPNPSPLLHKDLKESRDDIDNGTDDQASNFQKTLSFRGSRRGEAKTSASALASASQAASARTKPDTFGALSEDDFERCRESLRASFSTCSPGEFAILSIILSSVLNSFRRLHRYELYGLLTLSLGRLSSIYENFVDLVEIVFGKVEIVSTGGTGTSLFLEHSDGSLDFGDECMGRFLSTYGIWGLDMTHEVLVYACVQQLEMDSDTSDPLFSALGFENLHYMSAFSNYAQEFWMSHYQLAEVSCPLLLERVHRLIYTWSCRSVTIHEECTWQAPCQDIADTALACCTANHLRTLAQFYVRVGARTSDRQECAAQRRPVTDIPNLSLEAAMSQLHLAGKQNCIRDHQSRSSSPGPVSSSTPESWFEEQRWILV